MILSVLLCVLGLLLVVLGVQGVVQRAQWSLGQRNPARERELSGVSGVRREPPPPIQWRPSDTIWGSEAAPKPEDPYATRQE